MIKWTNGWFSETAKRQMYLFEEIPQNTICKHLPKPLSWMLCTFGDTCHVIHSQGHKRKPPAFASGWLFLNPGIAYTTNQEQSNSDSFAEEFFSLICCQYEVHK